MAEENPGGNYGKRPMWQWIVLYVIIGAIVYGLFYFFVLAKKGGSGYNSSSTPQQQNSSPY